MTPQIILDLVARFADNQAAYRSGLYNETQVRREFIDPFFAALGWDVNNERGYAEAYKDVIHEDAIKVGGATKAPDYCFRIGGTRKFFLEAKKPSVNIKGDPAPAYQLRRYAWSAKLPLSILTDFEEFAVYDCRVKPDQGDGPGVARTLYFTFKEYPARWEEIAGIFAREAVLKGSFDKYAESNKAKKGTTEVDAAFLQEIENWRKLLAQNLALRNPQLSQRALNLAVQSTIDRLIFLRICEDRGIEEYGQLMALLNGSQVYERLGYLLRRADERYNSGLFHFHAEAGSRPEAGRADPPDELTLNLIIDDKPLKEIIGDLYYPASPYEFSVLPAEILGQVYEQFLGKVIRLTAGHHAVVEDKPEVKKAGGVYYTPAYIVAYIVKQTVGKLVEDKTLRQAGGEGKAPPLRVLDPACGSGSFLIGAYQFLLDWFRDGYVADGPEKWTTGRSARLFQHSGGDWALTTGERKRILLNHIYGVDIDPQAVEVTKLSLLLKVLEGENQQTLARQLSLFQERALPDLGANIKCGNSLIGPDFYESQQLSLLDEEEMYRVNVFDWQASFPQLFSGDEDGFDAVIGNPPYVRQELLGNYKKYFQQKYQVYNGIADLYVYFLEKGVSLLNSGGVFSYIVANKWMRANYGEPLRRWLQQQPIEEIIDFGDLPVFQTATTYPCILRIHKGASATTFHTAQIKTLDFTSLEEYVGEHMYTLDRTNLGGAGWSLAEEGKQRLIDKIWTVSVPLNKYSNERIYYGIKTGLNEAFIINEVTRAELINQDPKSEELIKPFLMGRDIKRYQAPRSDRYLIFTRRGLNIKNYPAIERHLSKFKDRLMPKPIGWKGENWPGRKPGIYQWYEIQDTVDYYAEFEKPKIIIPAIVQNGSYTFDTEAFYSNDKTSIIPTEDKYLLGILNSKVPDFVMHLISSTKQGGYFEYKPMYLEQLPIRPINFADPADKARHDRMLDLVEGMLGLQRRLAAAQTTFEKNALQQQINATDRQIDKLVYELYGLSAAEIAIVEQGMA
ncbi:MAG: restriction endonuclease subunit R [Chloroflexi bacterium]|nr:restriction endonuclease subunit R [Chloroflexota bacterium]